MSSHVTLGTRVLFIEDEASTRRGYTAYLSGRGYDVSEATTGEHALTLATHCVPDVIVLDLGLPDIDGWEVARRLKASPQTAAVPIIALTGSTLPHERISAMRAGCDRHLPKPCVPEALLEAIRQCVEHAKQQRAD
jgi:two-component system, cell cycle response regulator DivK